MHLRNTLLLNFSSMQAPMQQPVATQAAATSKTAMPAADPSISAGARAVEASLQAVATPSQAAAAMTPAAIQDLATQLSSISERQVIDEDRSSLVTSQSAELASARQAMQTMLQLLESSLPAEQPAADITAQQQEVQVKASQPASAQASGSLQDLFAQLTRHLAESEPVAAAADELIADQGQLVASQAAELASATQAMQLLAQLLETEAADGAAAETGLQSAEPAAREQHQPAESREQLLHDDLQQVLALLQARPVSSMAAGTIGQDAQAVSQVLREQSVPVAEHKCCPLVK